MNWGQTSGSVQLWCPKCLLSSLPDLAHNPAVRLPAPSVPGESGVEDWFRVCVCVCQMFWAVINTRVWVYQR